MAGSQGPKLEGHCYYGGGGVFQVTVYDKVFDEDLKREVRKRAPCPDPRVIELVRQGFELLVSSDPQRRIGSVIVERTETGGGMPKVTIPIGPCRAVLIQSKSGSGTAKFEWHDPFQFQDEAMDMAELAETASEPEEGEGDEQTA